MKWTIHELVRQENINNEIDSIVDLSEYIEDTDIIRISPITVTGDYEIYENEEFVFYLNIKGVLIVPCAITLKEVEYPIDIDVEEVFTTYKNEESNTIEGITIDLLPIIWSNIILEKPIRIVSENAYEEVSYENDEIEVEKQNVFASLKDYNK